jgi:hypothetical protein
MEALIGANSQRSTAPVDEQAASAKISLTARPDFLVRVEGK